MHVYNTNIFLFDFICFFHKWLKVVELLERLKPVLPNVYLSAPMPEIYRETKDEYHLPKGVSNRNKGLEWILKFGVDDAVVYFADDDNTYDLRLFHEVWDKSIYL